MLHLWQQPPDRDEREQHADHVREEDGATREPHKVANRHVALRHGRGDHDEHRARDSARDAKQIAHSELLAEKRACDDLVCNDAHGAERRNDRRARKAKRQKVEHLAEDGADEPEPPERLLGVRLPLRLGQPLVLVVHPLLPVEPRADDQVGADRQADARDRERRVGVEADWRAYLGLPHHASAPTERAARLKALRSLCENAPLGVAASRC
mmetsp:Transcript_9802/g.31005  ORF Transcript_9802/g.31005 Transcript_9802/m.31005 type:complete len:211 (-) Transcript_9802:3-635(-)